MDEFYQEYHDKLFEELKMIQNNLNELKQLIEEDKKLLEKIRKKRAMKQDQKAELFEEVGVA